jgi:DNA-binding MarR family transcriptional regulator
VGSTADPQELLRLDRQLCFTLYSSSLLMTKLYAPVLARLQLTYPQYLVMLVLWESDALTVGAMGKRLCLDTGTLTPLLKRLQAAGRLRRERSLDDERRVIVSLTPQGHALRHQAGDIPLQVACATGCTLDDIAKLTARLQGLRRHIASHLDAASH